LSLLNTEWYIKQMRDQWSHESPTLPISLSNAEIEKITSAIELRQPDTISIPVDKAMLKEAFSGPQAYRQAIDITSHEDLKVYDEEVDFDMPVDSLDSQLAWYYEGRPAGE